MHCPTLQPQRRPCPQVPLSCVPMIVEGKVNVNTTISHAFDDT